jgi:hypothetical protein
MVTAGPYSSKYCERTIRHCDIERFFITSTELFVTRFLAGFLTLIFASSGLAFGQTAPKSAPSGKAAAQKPAKYAVPFVNKTLPNGLEVIVLPDASVPIVSVELAVRNGSFTEPPELNGLSHLYEHMFFKPNQAAMLAQCDMAKAQYGRVSERCDPAFQMRSRLGDVSYLKSVDQMGIDHKPQSWKCDPCHQGFRAVPDL